jgi:tetratricopeptide (TPR) repeat protein
MLLETGRPAEALSAFESVLAASPNRLNTLYGAGLAAERASDTAKARHYYEELVRGAADADADLSRVEQARAFLAENRVSRSE